LRFFFAVLVLEVWNTAGLVLWFWRLMNDRAAAWLVMPICTVMLWCSWGGSVAAACSPIPFCA
jgi:hypothetical protein